MGILAVTSSPKDIGEKRHVVENGNSSIGIFISYNYIFNIDLSIYQVINDIFT